MSVWLDPHAIKEVDKNRYAETVLVVDSEHAKDRILIRFHQGIGDNLLREDARDGYVDYIDWTSFYLSCEEDLTLNEDDCGMVLLREMYDDTDPEDILKGVIRERFDEDDNVKAYLFDIMQ